MGIVDGKVVIVTGGTRGIGYSIVKEFLKNGAKVALAGSRKETVDEAIAKLAEEGLTDNVMGISPNLTDPDSVKEAFDAVVQRFGRLDVLCNNAGISSRTPLVDYTLEEFQKVMDLNVTAVFVCSQAAARIMIEQGEGGAIVNTSSMGGQARPAFWVCLSHLQVRREWSHPLAGARVGEVPHSRERGGAGRDSYRHGGCAARVHDQAADRLHSAGAHGRAGRHCQRLSVPGLRHGRLHLRCGAASRRPLPSVTFKQPASAETASPNASAGE